MAALSVRMLGLGMIRSFQGARFATFFENIYLTTGPPTDDLKFTDPKMLEMLVPK